MTASSTKKAAAQANAAEQWKIDKRIPFPAAGDGAFFDFTVRDLIDLEEAIKPDRDQRESFFATAERLLLGGNPKAVRDCVDIGLKQEDEAGKPAPLDLNMDDPPFPLMDAVEPVLNALCYAVHKKSYAQAIEDARLAHEEALSALRGEDGEAA